MASRGPWAARPIISTRIAVLQGIGEETGVDDAAEFGQDVGSLEGIAGGRGEEEEEGSQPDARVWGRAVV